MTRHHLLVARAIRRTVEDLHRQGRPGDASSVIRASGALAADLAPVPDFDRAAFKVACRPTEDFYRELVGGATV